MSAMIVKGLSIWQKVKEVPDNPKSSRAWPIATKVCYRELEIDETETRAEIWTILPLEK